VGTKPGDWVEVVDQEAEDIRETIDRSVHCRNRSLDGVFVLNGKQEAEGPSESPAELNGLMDQLYHVQTLLKKSEIKRHEALQDLKENNARNEAKEKSLRAKIKNQEAMNKKASRPAPDFADVATM